jgi:GH35 family endo-1,4-beta-xylanase
MPRSVTLLICLAAAAAAQIPLRSIAAQRALFVGAAADYQHLGKTDYTTTLAREYSVLEPENDMKWATIHPNPPGSTDEYNFVPGRWPGGIRTGPSDEGPGAQPLLVQLQSRLAHQR